jgi:predicted nucleic acid-binding Zn ribbon protein
LSLDLTEIQDGILKKRVVKLIIRYPEPKQIFQAITQKQHQYTPDFLPAYPIRDRAIMALYYASAGRGSEVVPGHAFTRSLPTKLNSEGKHLCVVCNKPLEGYQRKFCSEPCRLEVHTHRSATILEEMHLGILAENVTVDENKILVSRMETVKRSQKIKEKYPNATIRPDYWIPLKTGLYEEENPYWDQLVPFAWLILEYLQTYAPKTGPLFNIQRHQAYIIVREITGNYLNWFRAQGKQFYGKFLFKRNAVELAEFVNDKDFNSERAYTRYDATTQLKDKRMVMDFDWIQPAIETIKARIKK